MASILDRAQKARTKSIQLEGLDYAKELQSQILTCAKYLEQLYPLLKKAVADDPPSEPWIAKLVNQFELKEKWWEKAEVGCCKNSLCQQC